MLTRVLLFAVANLLVYCELTSALVSVLNLCFSARWWFTGLIHDRVNSDSGPNDRRGTRLGMRSSHTRVPSTLVLVLVLVKIRQRAVLITPVCPMSYGRSAISRLFEDIKWAGLRHRGGETVPDWNSPMNHRILEEVRACSLLLELVTMSSSGADICATSNPKSSVVTTTSPFMAL